MAASAQPSSTFAANRGRQTAIITTMTSIRTNTLTHRTDPRQQHRTDKIQHRTDRDPDRTDPRQQNRTGTRLKITGRWKRSSG